MSTARIPTSNAAIRHKSACRPVTSRYAWPPAHTHTTHHVTQLRYETTRQSAHDDAQLLNTAIEQLTRPWPQQCLLSVYLFDCPVCLSIYGTQVLPTRTASKPSARPRSCRLHATWLSLGPYESETPQTSTRCTTERHTPYSPAFGTPSGRPNTAERTCLPPAHMLTSPPDPQPAFVLAPVASRHTRPRHAARTSCPSPSPTTPAVRMQLRPVPHGRQHESSRDKIQWSEAPWRRASPVHTSSLTAVSCSRRQVTPPSREKTTRHSPPAH